MDVPIRTGSSDVDRSGELSEADIAVFKELAGDSFNELQELLGIFKPKPKNDESELIAINEREKILLLLIEALSSDEEGSLEDKISKEVAEFRVQKIREASERARSLLLLNASVKSNSEPDPSKEKETDRLTLKNEIEAINKSKNAILKIINACVKSNGASSNDELSIEDEDAPLSPELGRMLTDEVENLAEEAKRLLSGNPNESKDELGIMNFELSLQKAHQKMAELLGENSDALTAINGPINNLLARVKTALDLKTMSLEQIEQKLTALLTTDRFPETSEGIILEARELLEEAQCTIRSIENGISIAVMGNLISQSKVMANNFIKKLGYLYEGKEPLIALINEFLGTIQAKIEKSEKARRREFQKKESYARVNAKYLKKI